MSIRAIAVDLYKAQQKRDAIKTKLEAACPADLASLEIELRGAEQEYKMIKRMLDGEKESGAFRTKFGQFGFKL